MEESTIALFCCLDDFARMVLDWERHKLIPSDRQQLRAGILSLGEMLFIMALFHVSSYKRELWIRTHSRLGKTPVVLTLLELSSSLQCTTKPSNFPLWGRMWFFWRPGENYLSPGRSSRLRYCLLTQVSLSIIGVNLMHPITMTGCYVQGAARQRRPHHRRRSSHD